MKCKCCGAKVMTRETFKHTPSSFKDNFKVGDIVLNACWCKTVVITAIGKFRFLSIDSSKFSQELGGRRVNDLEKPNTMYGYWKKISSVEEEIKKGNKDVFVPVEW